ncbi:kynurenine/alpha-aminoadipate aminotransferase [Pseudozyma hubeiensis SY62]|uniref:Kynurenine/alpha-aminoadipate aminotransferase n=1 Tax=Pseudozyma hubeiensis (strain SY62) TaxID=1305764 RepID=R9PD52_PSEHS|nr:kynurenine/alpha-aminoadipate aminotransferase [Pseudozyma hubeiensis SY62]GAC99284.1 kynurenine/alpha-aminoadipate aminotransferase [Pseudozyma hubeiensis SY62]
MHITSSYRSTESSQQMRLPAARNFPVVPFKKPGIFTASLSRKLSTIQIQRTFQLAMLPIPTLSLFSSLEAIPPYTHSGRINYGVICPLPSSTDAANECDGIDS